LRGGLPPEVHDHGGPRQAQDGPITARIGIGIAVRSEVPWPDVSSGAALTQALLSADMIVFNNVASGNYFATVIDKLGIAEMLRTNIQQVAAADVFNRVLQGKGHDVAIGTIPQILATQGLKPAGPLPADYQAPIPYSAAIMASASERTAAGSFIGYLHSDEASAMFKAAGVD
jgi:molybdate transport system substrate-binding protein